MIYLVKKMSFKNDLDFGNSVQEKLIAFLEKYWSLEFVAGDRNGITVNPKKIEEVFKCKYVPVENYVHGARLRFIDYNNKEEVEVVMPDELFIHKKTGSYVWVESKGRRNNEIYEKKSKIDDYRRVQDFSGSKVYIMFAVQIFGTDCFDIYSSPVGKVVDTVIKNGVEYCVYNQDDMKKLNKYPV